MSIVDKVQEKIQAYGITIYDHYDIEDTEHVFYIEDSIVFVNPDKKTLSIAFQATTKPDRVASLTLILSEVKCKKINIMESFIFNSKNEFISGDDAFNLIKSKRQADTMKEIENQVYYRKILESENCFEC